MTCGDCSGRGWVVVDMTDSGEPAGCSVVACEACRVFPHDLAAFSSALHWFAGVVTFVAPHVARGRAEVESDRDAQEAVDAVSSDAWGALLLGLGQAFRDLEAAGLV